MQRRSLSGPGRRLLRGAGVCLLASAAFAACVGWRLGGKTFVLYVDDLATLAAAAAAAGCCIRARARHPRAFRRFWTLLGGACVAWSLAEAIWALYELVLVEDVPVPSLADIGYLAAMPLAAAALLSHPAMRGPRARTARSAIDALLVAAALLFLSWTAVLGPLWRTSDLTTAGGIVALAYPFGDVVITFLVVLVVRRMTGGGRAALWCLLAGLLAMAVADSGYAYLTGIQSYAGGLLDTGWIVAYLGIALGAYCSDPLAGVSRSRWPSRPGLAAVVLPLLPVLLALTLVGLQIDLGSRPDDVALSAAMALVVLVLVRQALLVVDVLSTRGPDDGGIVEQLYAAFVSSPAGGEGT